MKKILSLSVSLSLVALMIFPALEGRIADAADAEDTATVGLTVNPGISTALYKFLNSDNNTATTSDLANVDFYDYRNTQNAQIGLDNDALLARLKMSVRSSQGYTLTIKSYSDTHSALHNSVDDVAFTDYSTTTSYWDVNTNASNTSQFGFSIKRANTDGVVSPANWGTINGACGSFPSDGDTFVSSSTDKKYRGLEGTSEISIINTTITNKTVDGDITEFCFVAEKGDNARLDAGDYNANIILTTNAIN